VVLVSTGTSVYRHHSDPHYLVGVHSMIGPWILLGLAVVFFLVARNRARNGEDWLGWYVLMAVCAGAAAGLVF